MGRIQINIYKTIDCLTAKPNKMEVKRELGWKQSYNFDKGLRETVRWYLNNTDWIDNVRSGEYQNWIEKNYGER